MYKYDFDEYSKDIATIVTQVVASGIEYDWCVGISRGGLIPGVHLSHVLELPFKPLQWSTRDYVGRDLQHEMLTNPRYRILLVDDICDSGRTLSEITTYPFFKAKIDTAVLISNIAQPIIPTYVGQTIDRNTFTSWFDFWWER